MASSGSSLIPNSGSEEDLHAVLDQRKKKRMLSNRESARRSRQKKRKHLDDLMAEVTQSRNENNQILTALNITTQHYLVVESENSVLRTQMMELSTRLQSLNDIISCANGSSNGFGFLCDDDDDGGGIQITNDSFMRPWDLNLMMMNQPIMASPDMFQYC